MKTYLKTFSLLRISIKHDLMLILLQNNRIYTPTLNISIKSHSHTIYHDLFYQADIVFGI